MRAVLGLLMVAGAVTCTEVKGAGAAAAVVPAVVVSHPSHVPVKPQPPGLLTGIRGLLLSKNAFLFQRPLLALSTVAKAVGNSAEYLAARVTEGGLLGLNAASQSLAGPYDKPVPPPTGHVEPAVVVVQPVVIHDKGSHHNTHHRSKGHHAKGATTIPGAEVTSKRR